MKKLLSVLLSASIFASLLAVPAFADYTAADYDVERLNETYNNGTVTNTIDSSQAKHFTTSEDVFGGAFDGKGYLESDFFLSLDFNYYTDDSGNVPGSLRFTNPGGLAGTDETTGPEFTYDKDGGKKYQGQLVAQDSSNKWNPLGEITPDSWYTLEFEGKCFNRIDVSLYKYEGSAKTLVKKYENLWFRNYGSGSKGKNPSVLVAHDIYIDNVKFYSTYPNAIDVTTATGEYELNAGSSVPLEYSLSRTDGLLITNTYPATLELLDDSGNPLDSDSGVSLATGNVLVADIDAPTQTVTVKASAVLGDNTLIDTRTKIKVNAVSTSGETFDEVTIDGPDSIKAGEAGTYTLTAKKNGATVELSDGDYEWSIYTTDDLYKNGNKAITITGGTTVEIAVADSVIAQKMHVTVSSKPNGFVRGSKEVSIEFSDSQTEQVIVYNACEDSIGTATRVESIDGSNAYLSSGMVISLPSSRSDYVLTEFDARFTTDGSNVCWETNVNGGSNWNSSIHRRGDLLRSQHNSNSYPSYDVNATADDWFHFEVLYSPDNASCIITKYNADGTLGESVTRLDIERRNAKAYGSLTVSSGVIIDNIKISLPTANELVLNEPSVKEILAGQSLEFSATSARNGLPLKGTQLDWQVIGEDGLVITGDDALIKINNGVLTTDPLAKAQTVTVKVSSGEFSKEATVQILTSEIFEIRNIGKNEEGTKITRLYVNKKFNYNNEVLFIIAIYNSDGVLTGVSTRQMYGDQLQLGENELTFDFNLPDSFNPDTDEVSVMTWTMF